MGRSSCHQCGVFEEYYRLKLSVYLLHAKTSKPAHRAEAVAMRHRLITSREELRDAQRAVLAHWRDCEHRKQSEARAALRMDPDQLAITGLERKPAA